MTIEDMKQALLDDYDTYSKKELIQHVKEFESNRLDSLSAEEVKEEHFWRFG